MTNIYSREYNIYDDISRYEKSDFLFDLEKQLKELPLKSGVYIMKSGPDEIIYVGKAKNLRNRVRQYFQDSSSKAIKTANMVRHIKEFEYIVTESEMEALILENNLIKENKPKYNILLKDDKTYPYIKVTVNEDFPKIELTRKVIKDKARYFGPFSSDCRNTIDIAQKIWTVRTCSRKLPKEMGKERPCLNHHIGKCLAPCNGLVSKAEYADIIDEVLEFLSGKHQSIIKAMSEKMQIASDNMDFELAAEYRDKINSIRNIEQTQLLESGGGDNQDIIAFAKAHDEALVQVFFIRGGKMTGREHFMLKVAMEASRQEIMGAFVTQFYSETTFIPKELVLEDDIEDREIVAQWLTKLKGASVTITIPQKGQKHKLIKLAHENAIITLEQFGEKIKREEQRTLGAVGEIKSALGLEVNLERIEAYDISNIQGYESVGSMVVFENGKPKRSDYRKFKIKTVIGPNDYASMEEVLRRRFKRYFDEAGSEDSNMKAKFSKLPDIIFMDGGKGQVGIAEKVLEEMGLAIPVCGMVKDDKHKTRGLLYNNREVMLPLTSEGFKLITRIQDEVHRFAIEYHRTLRQKSQIKSVLDDIEGIGANRRKALLRHFATIENIMAADISALKEVEGMNIRSAQAVYDFFRKV